MRGASPRTTRATGLRAVLLHLLLQGCQPPPCGGPSPWTAAPAGAPCPGGPQGCEPGLGCNDGTCGSCITAADCLPLDGCSADGACGACATDAECRDGETCREGACLAPVARWDLGVDPSDWESLHENWWEDVYHPCSLTADGVAWTGSCEVRAYGSTARVYPKKSVRIRLEGDGAPPGYGPRVTLRAEYNDPTFLRNHLGYETFRHLTTLPTPRSRFVQLSVNGAVYGLMLELERTDGEFLALNGRDPEASCYEAEHAPPYGALVPLDQPEHYRFIDDDEIYNKKSGDEDDYGDLIRFVEEVAWADYLDSDGVPTGIHRLGAAMDVDAHVAYLVVQALIQNRDHVAANYHISLQPLAGGRATWEVYPYDLDTSFGCVFDEVEGNNICDELTAEVWWLNGVVPDGQVAGAPEALWINMPIHLVLNHGGCLTLFYERMATFLEGTWWNERLPAAMAGLQAHLAPLVAEDPNDLNDSAADHEAAVEDMIRFLSDRRAYLLASMGY